MKKRLFLAISFIVLLSFIRCNCPDPGMFYYNWSDVIISYHRWYLHEDGSYWNSLPTDETVFRGPTFGLELKMELQEISKSDIPINFSNSVFATEPCDPDTYKPKTKIVNFSIYTLNDFDDSHQKDSDITEYFFLGYMKESNLITELNYPSTVFYKEASAIILSKVPSKGTLHKFKIEFELEDGSKLVKETKEVTLLPSK